MYEQDCVMGVDPGFSNLALCLRHKRTGDVVFWWSGQIYDRTFTSSFIPFYIHRLIFQWFPEHFARAETVVVERQMRRNMLLIENAFYCFLYGKAEAIHPKKLKHRLAIRGDNWLHNKKNAVQYLLQHFPKHSCIERAAFEQMSATQQHNYADAFLITEVFLKYDL